jgi:predicted dehydrogenase
VSICTRNNQHVEPTIAAAGAGVKGIIVEKPMAMNLQDADRMIEACQRAGTKLLVDHTMRFEANYRHLKSLIEQGAIGDLTSIEVLAIGDLGELTHNITHSFDTLCMFAGKPEWLFAHLERHIERRNDREDLYVIVGFPAGVRGKIVYGGYSDYRYEGFIWEGTKGRIETRSVNGWQPTIRLWTPENPGSSDFRDGEHMPSIENDPWATAIQELVAALNEDREPISNGADGRLALELTMAVYESRRQGTARIELPLTIQESPLELMLQANQIPTIWGRGLQTWT